MRRFLGQFATTAKITDDAGTTRRVFNPWGPLKQMESDVAPVADLVINDILAIPGNSIKIGLLSGLFINLVPQVWGSLNRSGLIPPLPEYLRVACLPLAVMVVWLILAMDQRNRVAARLLAYGRCPCCCYRLRELAPDASHCVHCTECNGCWKLERIGTLREPPTTIDGISLKSSGCAVADNDGNYRPVPNLRPLRADASFSTMAHAAWNASGNARLWHILFYSALGLGCASIIYFSLSSALTIMAYVEFTFGIVVFSLALWLIYSVWTGRTGTGIKLQAAEILRHNRCPCCLTEIPPAIAINPRKCNTCGSRWQT